MINILVALCIIDPISSYYSLNTGRKRINYSLHFPINSFKCKDNSWKTKEGISVPPGGQCSMSVVSNDVPSSSFILTHFTCPAVGIIVAGARCYIDVKQNGDYINDDHPKHGSSIDGSLDQKATNETTFKVYLQNKGTEMNATFGEPLIQMYKYEEEFKFLESTKSKMNDHNVSVLKASIDETQGKIHLHSLHLINAYKVNAMTVENIDFGYSGQIMRVPIIANSTHILGINILDDAYIHAWRYVQRL